MTVKSTRTFNSILITLLVLLFVSCSSITNNENQNLNSSWFNYDTVKAQRFDTGRMWTFEHAPVDYFYETYGFKPSAEWLYKAQTASLKFANWCSASFVSEDGLIMTNHHCIDMIAERIQQDGEDILRDGFIAEDLKDERKVSNLYVNQLVYIKDVTEEIFEAIDKVEGAEAKEKAKTEKINELKKLYEEETGLDVRVTSLYNGGMYSVYGYRKYSDVRAVFFAESEMGLYGGDPDNFTFPRYNLDCAFLRVYDDDGKPLKTDNYFKWSTNGPVEGEPLFVVGYPGSTKRLKTVSQMKYYRDHSIKSVAARLTGLTNILGSLMEKYPDKRDKYEKGFIMISNSAKVYDNQLKALRDPYLIARKQDFENKFKEAVFADANLNQKYGYLWDAIEKNRAEMSKIAPEINSYSVVSRFAAEYFNIAADLLQLSYQLSLPEDQRGDEYKEENLDAALDKIFPEDFDAELEELKLALYADLMSMNLGSEHKNVKILFGGFTGAKGAEYALSRSTITSKEDLLSLAKKGAEAIMKSDDPFISFLLETQPILSNHMKIREEISSTEGALEEELGRALYEVYGTTIPPDATFTLRISDGLMQTYEYNGTKAPLFTTFYGLYDRYYSYNGKYPWNITDKWKNPAEGFDMRTEFNFISTCDITGGSSGSPVINQHAEVVGLAFDGNIESIEAEFLFTTGKNRMVSVTSQGMLEAIKNIYRFPRLSEELRNGKVPEEYKLAGEPEEAE